MKAYTEIKTFFALAGGSFSRTWWVFLKELNSFLGSNLPPISLGAVAFFCGLVSIVPYQSGSTYEQITRFLFHMFYIIILMAGIVLSMSAFVNERRQGTMELLYTLPVNEAELVLGKFLMSFFLIVLMVVSMTLCYIFWIAEAPLYIVIGGAIGLILAGSYAASVGIFASSLTENHLISLLIGIAIIGVIDIGGFLAGLLPSVAKDIFSHLHGLDQFMPFTRGALTLRSILFFAGFQILFLFLTVRVLESRRWRGSRN